MPERQQRVPSVRGRLMLYLLLPLIFLMTISIWADHRVIAKPVNDAFDHALSHAALVIAAHVKRTPDGQLKMTWPSPMPPMLRPWFGQRPGPGQRPRPEPGFEPGPGQEPSPDFVAGPNAGLGPWSGPGARERMLYRVSRPNGETLAGTADLPMVSANDPGGLDFADLPYRDTPFRVVSYRTDDAGEPLVITVADTMQRRHRALRKLDAAIGISDFIQLLLVLAIALIGITVALRPLKRLRDKIVSREPQSLEPLPAEPVPSEVGPLVESLNALLSTVRDSAMAQQHFLTNAAHQLRTPLTGLKAQLEVLRSETTDGPQQARIALLQGGIDRLAHTANQLLALARAEPSAHRASDFAVLSLPVLVNEAVEVMLDRAVKHQIDLGAECAPAQVNGVRWLLHEMLVNLLDNAIRHTPEGGQVTVRCGIEHGVPYLEVEDSGPGIPPAERERVRERFYSAPRGNNHGHGSGLGLAIVEEVVRVHLARLSILDSHEGQGARMRIDMPPVAATKNASRSSTAG
ncbi:MAG: sensor histidine kinase [Rhodanobacter sp.]